MKALFFLFVFVFACIILVTRLLVRGRGKGDTRKSEPVSYTKFTKSCISLVTCTDAYYELLQGSLLLCHLK